MPRAIPRRASQVNEITDRMLEGYPGPEEVYPAFRDFIGGATLVAHNASFDIAFLAHEMGRLGMSLPIRYVCTLRLARMRLPGLPDHRLETVCRHYYGGMPGGVSRHRALDDARLTARVWLALMEH
ncbi:MAG TPA: 3'-5' exonuclease [Geobacteraceae bacterium]|nr:3'-5' exonuclease [Geobacteraceae bacterium]